MALPTREHLAKLLRAGQEEVIHKALMLWGPHIATEFPLVYKELLEIIRPLDASSSPLKLELPENATKALTCDYKTFCAAEQNSNFLASSVWRLLREFPREEPPAVDASALAKKIVGHVRMVSEYEKLAVRDTLAARCPIGWEGHPETYLRKEKLIDTVLDRKELVDRHVFFIWQFSHWYKQKTTRSWDHYYIRWSEWGKQETIQRLFNQVYNMRPRRPLVLHCGHACWLVHRWTEEGPVVCLCENPVQAVAVWIHLVQTEYDSQDSFDCPVPS